MDTTISKTVYPHGVSYTIKKWDDNNKVIDTYRTNKKYLAVDKFSEFSRETYKK